MAKSGQQHTKADEGGQRPSKKADKPQNKGTLDATGQKNNGAPAKPKGSAPKTK